eukprot:GILJ01008952.1.p1 GENE.GILJ01008952.1~~GILJ01008952.1.p1  ORF type:complete len:334 (+),score=52.34 GILJ01008952.1:35-1036(+)
MSTNNSTNVLPWVEKYRPSRLEDLNGHQDIISTITRFINENKLPHLLFYGPPGTGKTSTILACARKMYGNNFNSMVLELNASDERGIDVVREEIKNFASTQQIFSTGIKLIILDEADAMTSAAQFALRRVIERYTKNTRFCMICNYVSKIIPALQSRCTRFRFAPLPRSQVLERASYIAQQEQLKFTDAGLEAVVKLSGGDMRKVLNIMQSTSMAFDEMTEEAVYLCTGNPLPIHIEQIVSWLMNERFSVALNHISTLKTLQGLALTDMLKGIHTLVMRIDFPPKIRMQLLIRLADIEYRLAFGANEKIQVGSLVGCFQEVRETMASSAQAQA